MEIQSIHGGYEITGRYRCKNRLLGVHIRMDTVKFNVNKSYELKYFLTCEDHGDHKDDNINKTDATFWMRKPWLWCDECAALHFNQEGYIENDYLGDVRSDDL
jgi:hypothetical protein